MHRLADHLGIVIIIMHVTGHALFGSNRTRRWRVLIEVEGDGDVLHAVRAGLLEGTFAGGPSASFAGRAFGADDEDNEEGAEAA